MCHCLERQRRTGAVISNQARFRREQWENEGFPGHVTVAIGNFADSTFPAPTIAVWEESRHPWVSLPPDTPPKRVAKQG